MFSFISSCCIKVLCSFYELVLCSSWGYWRLSYVLYMLVGHITLSSRVYSWSWPYPLVMQYFLVLTSFHCFPFKVQPFSWSCLVSLQVWLCQVRGPGSNCALVTWRVPTQLTGGYLTSRHHFHCSQTMWLVTAPAGGRREEGCSPPLVDLFV